MITNELENYNKIIKKRNKIRWIGVILYFLIVSILTLLPFFIKIDFSSYGTIFIIIVFGGIIPLFALLFYPFFNQLSLPIIADDQVIEMQRKFEHSSVFREEVRLKLIYIIVVPFLILFTGLSGWFMIDGDYAQSLTNGIAGLFFLLVIIIFDPLTITADSEKILLKFGPIKDTILIGDIETIRSVIVKPIRDFMGPGKRLGPDGSIGYIAYLKTGVRMELNAGKVYVVSMKNPQEFVDFIRYFKKL